MCQRECVLFGFNPGIKKCRTHKKRLTSGLSDEAGWRYYSVNAIPKDCNELCEEGQTITGVYDIYPYNTLTIPISVYCDMTTMDGGWTVIQKRVDGSVSFDRNWADYKNGFGSPEQNVWIGDSMRSCQDLSGMYFSTPDRDNDNNSVNCAATHDRRGGWWFNACHWAFLNGRWSPARWSAPWSPTVTHGTSVNGTTMMVRRH